MGMKSDPLHSRRWYLLLYSTLIEYFRQLSASHRRSDGCRLLGGLTARRICPIVRTTTSAEERLDDEKGLHNSVRSGFEINLATVDSGISTTQIAVVRSSSVAGCLSHWR